MARLEGRVRAPGDKSVSHRALMFGALALGETTIAGLLTGEDVLRTAAALRALGARVDAQDDGVWRVRGFGVGGGQRAGRRARSRQFRHLGAAARRASWPATASPPS